MAEKILVIDDDPHTLRLMTLTLESEGYEVDTASQSMEGLRKVREGRPDLLILDIMMPDLDGYEVCRRLREAPETADLLVLMLTAKTQVADKVTGFKAGADDYVTKPADPAEIVARVKALLARAARAPQPQGKIIAFLGAKGGTGTTTVAVNVGVALAQSEQSVILVDLRPYFGTASIQLNLPLRSTIVDLLEMDPARVDRRDIASCLTLHHSGLRVLASPRDARKYATIPPAYVQAILGGLRTMADYILIDLPACPSLANREALMHCDFVALVTEPEPASLACAKATLALLDTLGISGEMVGIVVVNRSRSAAKVKLSQMESFLGRGFLGVVPPAPEACFDAERQGVPVVLMEQDELLVSSLKDLADRLAAERIAPQRYWATPPHLPQQWEE